MGLHVCLAPLTLLLLEGCNRAQVPRQASKAFQGPPATMELSLQVQLLQRQAITGDAPHHTHVSSLGHLSSLQAQGLFLQDSDFCGGGCRWAPSVSPVLHVTCFGEGPGQLGQDPVWSGTVPGTAGLLWGPRGTQQGLAVLLWVLGCGVRGAVLGAAGVQGHPRACAPPRPRPSLHLQAGVEWDVRAHSHQRALRLPLTFSLLKSECSPPPPSLCQLNTGPPPERGGLEVEQKQLLRDVRGQPTERSCRPCLLLPLPPPLPSHRGGWGHAQNSHPAG